MVMKRGSEPKGIGHSLATCVWTSGDALNPAAVSSGVSMVPPELELDGGEQDDGQDLADEGA